MKAHISASSLVWLNVFSEHTKNLLITSDVTYPFSTFFLPPIYFKPEWPVNQLQQSLAKNQHNKPGKELPAKSHAMENWD